MRIARESLRLVLRRAGVSFVAGLALVAGACRGSGAPATARPNVLLVTIDTLRADHLGAYGYPVPTSPHIDRLAARGARFGAALTTAPATVPATASLLTGRVQAATRVRRNGERLPAEATTLAELAAAAGWTTAAIVSNSLLVSDYGFDQGFQQFTYVPREHERSDDRVAAAAAAWLASATSPWFLWVHFMDVHGPPAADASWSRDFAYPPGTFGADPVLRVGRSIELGVIPSAQAVPGLDRLSQYVRRYDGDLRFTDAQIGTVLAALEASPAAANTLVVLTADHGEGLTEHGEYLQHAWYVYQTTLHVPLLIAWPGHVPAGTVVPARVSLLDVVPTVLELTGIAAPGAAATDGTSVAACLRGPCERPGALVALGGSANLPMALVDGDWKLVQTPGGVPPTPTEETIPRDGFATTERLELYWLDEDPGEVHDRSAAQPERVQAMRARLVEERHRLRALGWQWYPGSTMRIDDGAAPP
jgi:arylsulfatase